MKKWMPYLFGLAAMLLMVLVAGLIYKNKPRKLNERISLRQHDKIPYGTYVARHLMSVLFPASKMVTENNSPGNWDSLLADAPNQALIYVAKQFSASDAELEELHQFMRQGNTVFIIANDLSYEASRFFGADLATDEAPPASGADSLALQLTTPPFTANRMFIYPGKRYSRVFSRLDTSRTLVLGRNRYGQPNFIELQAGAGHCYVHLAPLAFSNYFILHKNNSRYFQQVMSVLPAHTQRIAWSEYYLRKPPLPKQRNAGLYRVLFRYPSFRWGLLTALVFLALYVVLQLRRKQRIIPQRQPLRNDSLDFVKTIGRLYYDGKDHLNLAKKMSAYFLDQVRTRYKVPVHLLDEAFVTAVHAKTGFPVQALNELVSFIAALETTPAISEAALHRFHEQLNHFCKTT